MSNEKPPLLTPENPAADHKDYDLPGEVKIKFQKGAMELGRNGCTTEELLDVLIDHIQGFQKTKFACEENHKMILHLQEAKNWTKRRAKVREAQGLKGRDAAHKPHA